MKPIALAFKDYEVNSFTGKRNGELMIIHQCTGCGKISPNRIAGDDNEHQILYLLEESLSIDDGSVKIISNLGINLITSKHHKDVLISLFGINYQKYFNK